MGLLLRGAEEGQGKQRGGRVKGKEHGGKGVGAFKGTPSECVTEILGEGEAKIRKFVGPAGGQSLNLVS